MIPGAPLWPFMPCSKEEGSQNKKEHTLQVTYMPEPRVHSCDNLVHGKKVCGHACVCVKTEKIKDSKDPTPPMEVYTYSRKKTL